MAKRGRPSKSEKFIEAMEEVVNEGINAIILTDAELFLVVNDKLTEENQICYTTFKNYKNSEDTEENAIYKGFLSVYKKALLKQKQELFKKLQSDPQSWQRFAWIIERKFSKWNLKAKAENKITVNDYTFTSNLEKGKNQT